MAKEDTKGRTMSVSDTAASSVPTVAPALVVKIVSSYVEHNKIAAADIRR